MLTHSCRSRISGQAGPEAQNAKKDNQNNQLPKKPIPKIGCSTQWILINGFAKNY